VASRPFTVRLLPDDRLSALDAPTDLYLAAAAAGILLEQPCGAQGTCGRCRVRVRDGAVAPSDAEREVLTEEELFDGWRLGCQLVLDGPATVEIPAVTRSLAGKSFGEDVQPEALSRPVVNTGIVEAPLTPGGVPASALLDVVAGRAGLVDRALTASPAALADLAAAVASGLPLAVVIHGRELIAVEPVTPETRDPVRSPARAGGVSQAGDAAPRSGLRRREWFGLAVDLGTTSLAAALVSLDDGRVVASASALNPQVAYGADVISRIRHGSHVRDGGEHLRDAIRQGLAALAADLFAASSCTDNDVVVASVAGNPTMMHTWLGVSCASLGQAPYLAAWADAMTVKASAAGLPIHPNANALAFPLVKSHVGGDAVAAALATGLDRKRSSTLLIDLGTNTELLLAHDGRVLATSAAAGPAFEGVGIRHGMRGAPGAIDVVSIAGDGTVTTHAIGGGRARGICGSGLIDAVAELLRVGVVTPTGYLRRADEIPAAAALAGRLTSIDGVNAFVLATGDDVDQAVGSIELTARDIRDLQLAKGSIVAAISLLCAHAGTEPAALDEVLVAGAFGNYIRKTSALRLGLLPGVDPERVRLVGNAAGVGARLALIDREVFGRARDLAARTEYVELATDARYQAAFMSALALGRAGTRRGRP
jgi:uncharacterized 2Fe-2S/4Fe-4S cluster protein (DUF4445 family)